MTSPPLVSIIIPVWNEEKYLEPCLESVLNQTYSHWECLLIDDGSTDKTPEILEKWNCRDSRFQYRLREHEGLIPSINYGFSQASGEIVTRMDGDDLMPLERLKKQVEKLQTEGSGNLITGKVKYFSETKISPGYQRYEDWLNSMHSPEDFLTNMFLECTFAAPSWMMYLSDVQKLGYFDKEGYPEDFNFSLKCHNNSIRFHSIPEFVLHWRDYSSRTSKISEDYSRPNFWKIRAFQFPKFYEKYTSQKPLAIWGSGESGIAFYKSLQTMGVFVQNFIDLESSHGNDSGIPIIHWKNEDVIKKTFISVCIGSPKGKEKIKDYLLSLNLSPIHDFMFMC